MVEELEQPTELLQQDPPSKKRALYDAVSKDYDLGSYEEFDKKLQDPAKRKSFYDGVGKEYDLGTYDEFEQKINDVKKKLVQSITRVLRSIHRYLSMASHS